MNQVRVIVRSVLAALLALTAAAAAWQGGQEPDRLCQMLFDEYIVRSGMINSATRTAAAHIVAERGRASGFWRDVLGELRKCDERTEIACVHLLGKMLEIDASARDALRRTQETGEVAQREPSILLGAEVVVELIARGAKADRFRARHYAIALARARVPEARGLLRRLLDDSGERLPDGDKFHAAVGLAQLGEPAGFEWLIANSDNPTPTVANAWPRLVPSLNLDVCCLAALRDLSARGDLHTRPEWQAWWQQTDKAMAARGHVALVEQ